MNAKLAAAALLMSCAPLHSQAPRSTIVPLADYHVHILGPYALPLPDAEAPEVAIPQELTALLADRVRLRGSVNTAADLDPVFTDDARLLNAYINPTGWIRDRNWFVRYINLAPPRSGVRYVPTAYEM